MVDVRANSLSYGLLFLNHTNSNLSIFKNELKKSVSITISTLSTCKSQHGIPPTLYMACMWLF